MQRDDEIGEENSAGPAGPPDGQGTDDDALADALEAETLRFTSPIAVIPPTERAESTETAPGSERSESAEPAAPVQSAEPVASAEPVETAQSAVPADAPRPPAAWSTLPAPDPAHAVPMPEPTATEPVSIPGPLPVATPPVASQPVTTPPATGSTAPPARTSMADEELSRWVEEASNEPGGTLDVIEQVEAQLKLRENDAREFQAWEDRMRSLGTPEALGAIDEARGQFGGVLPEAPAAPTTGSFVLPEQPVSAWPAPDFAETARAEQGEPEPEPEPEYGAETEPKVSPPAATTDELAPPATLPAWEVPAPSPSWAPPPEWSTDAASTDVASTEQASTDVASTEQVSTDVASAEQASAETAGPDPADADPADADPAGTEPAIAAVELDADALAQAPAPEPATRAPFDWQIPPEPEPEPEPVSAPESGSEPELVVEAEPELVMDPEPEPVPEPEPEQEPELILEPLEDSTGPVVPPPLIEPTPFDWSSPAAPARPAPVAPFTFDDILADDTPDDPPQAAAPETLFIEPMPVAAGEPTPTETGSIPVLDQAYEEELDDDVDETDRAFSALAGAAAADTAGTAAAAQHVSPPSGPISTVRIREDEQVLFDDEPVRQPVFSIEASDIEPTPVDHRVGRAARLFWLWFAANSSFLSLGLGAAVFAVGLSLRQSIVAILVGVAVSFLPLGLTTLAGKRSGQPTMVVSRATFGLIGNAVPAAIALVTRVFWGAVLLWLLASSVAVVTVGARLDGVLGERQILLIALAVAFLVAVLVAFAGYPMLARIQLVLSIVSGILVIGLIALTYQYIDIPQALTAADGPWLLTVGGAALVFSFVGLVWANSGADLARYQRTDSSGASSMLWATFGTTVPSFLLIGYGALLAASDSGIATGFLHSPLDTLARMLPSWYPVPLIAATALSLLSGVIISLYSGGFALQSLGVRVRRQWSIVIVGVLLGAISLLLGFGVTGGLNELLRDAATTLAVPTAAWAGIFAAETMIRNRRFESQSLVRRGGVYADVRWVNLVGLVVISAVGFGLTTATVSWLGWQGYGFALLGLPLDGDLAATDVGVFVALVLGLLLPIVAGIPAIRKQEATRV